MNKRMAESRAKTLAVQNQMDYVVFLDWEQEYKEYDFCLAAMAETFHVKEEEICAYIHFDGSVEHYS